MSNKPPATTPQKTYELEITEKVELYSELNSRLLNLFYTISHNLNAYTGNISLLLNIIDSGIHPHEEKEALRHLRTVSNDLNKTIENLSQIVYLQNTVNTAKEPLCVHEYIKKIEDTINGYGNDFKASFVNKVPENALVQFHPAYLESLLLNFSTNAVKYSHPERFPVIEFDLYTEQERSVLTIKDNGVGIDLDKYGDSLFGLNKTFHQHESANGFGLYITKYQVESMKGKIAVTSSVGEGTTFKIFFSK